MISAAPLPSPAPRSRGTAPTERGLDLRREVIFELRSEIVSPHLRDQFLAGLLVIGIAAFMLKAVVIMALLAAALFVVATVA